MRRRPACRKDYGGVELRVSTSDSPRALVRKKGPMYVDKWEMSNREDIREVAAEFDGYRL
jgi:hypothetical protein